MRKTILLLAMGLGQTAIAQGPVTQTPQRTVEAIEPLPTQAGPGLPEPIPRLPAETNPESPVAGETGPECGPRRCHVLKRLRDWCSYRPLRVPRDLRCRKQCAPGIPPLYSYFVNRYDHHP